MAQACLTNYFTPKRSARSATLSKSQSEKRKLHVDEENIENLGSTSTKKRRIAVHQPTDGYLPGCDLDQIDKKPLARKNKIDPEEKKVATFDRQKQRLAELVDLGELRSHLQSVRKHLNEVKGSAPSTPVKTGAAHERFAHLLVSPADLRQNVQNAENERLKKVLAKVDRTVIEALPTTPSKRIAGVNNRLLEQIRLKEESRSQLTSLAESGVIRDETQRVRTKEMFGHFSESIEIVDQLFTTERQVALEVDRIVEKFLELHSARFDREKAAQTIEFVLKETNECFAGYLVKMKLRNKEYLKINRIKFDAVRMKEFVQKKLVEFGDE